MVFPLMTAALTGLGMLTSFVTQRKQTREATRQKKSLSLELDAQEKEMRKKQRLAEGAAMGSVGRQRRSNVLSFGLMQQQ